MTERLYYKDSHLCEFEATVLSSKENGDHYEIILDKTAFFPEAGGQKSDKGTIGPADIFDVQIGEEIIHYSNKPLTEGEKYPCKIDFKRRLRFMQNHSGEHIISGVVHRLFGFNNVGFHLNTEMTVDFDGQLSNADLLKVEMLANEAVFKNTPIKTYFPSEDELKEINYRSKSDLEGEIRIVEIVGEDICACCAPHVKNTGEIGLIKITDCVKNKGGVRLTVKCGYDALEDYTETHENLTAISNALSVKRNEGAAAFERFANENKELKFSLSEMKKRLISSKAKTLNFERRVTATFEADLDIKELQLFSDALYKKNGGIRAVFSGEENSYSFAICGEENELNSFFGEFKKAFAVRGGGRNGIVQGTVNAEKKKIFEFLNTYYGENL